MEVRHCAWLVASLPAADLEAARRLALAHGDGSAVVSTCQRLEVFHRGAACGCPAAATGDPLRRLAELAAGLHSAVLGEAQVLGQVRTALHGADGHLRRQGAVAVAAARLLRAEARFETHTGFLLDRMLSLAGERPRGRIAIAGAGVVGRLVARRACELGFDEVVVFARSGHAESLAAGPVQVRPLAELHTCEPVRVLVTCLGPAAEPLTPVELPISAGVVFDLGTPRNVADAGRLPLLRTADLLAAPEEPGEAEARERWRRRLGQILEARREMHARDATSYVGRLRLEVERIRRHEVERARRLHPGIAPEQLEAITLSLVNQIFHRPSARLRALDDPILGAEVAGLFALEPEEHFA